MSDSLPVPFEDNAPALAAPSSLPELEQVLDEVPRMEADATLVLPTDTYAPWFRAIQRWLEQAGAKNGHDYKSAVSTAGMQGKKMLFRVRWTALTPKGVLYLNLMARTLNFLEAETRKIGMDEKPPETAENKQISPENG